MAQSYVRTLRQTHQTMTTLMPVLTAGLAVVGAVLATAESRRSSEPRTVSVLTPNANPAIAREARVSIIGVLAILVARALRLALAAVAAAGIVALWAQSDKTTRAIIVTVLILACLYLAERVARRFCRKG